jgi:hypothetical protein
MIRLLFWLAVYIIFFGIVSFKLQYRDGLKVNLKGWPEILNEKKN